MIRMKTALITGAAQGIGRAAALEFARLGHRTVLVDMNEAALAALKGEIEAMGREVTAYPCDVSDEARVREVCAAAVEKYGAVDILVNNAGLYRGYWGDFLETDSASWRRLIDVNILGTMVFCHALLPGMLEKRWGRIVNVGSVAGEYGLPSFVAYSTTKGAISSFTMALAKAVSDRGVTVNSIVPGMIRSSEDDPDCKGRQVNAVDRSGTPEECAKLIAFLASDDAAYISGQNYKIDGCRRQL